MSSNPDTVVVTSYVPNALDFIRNTAPSKPQSKHETAFAAIVNNRHVKHALAALPLTAVKKADPNSTVHLLNCVSAAYCKHVYGDANGPAVILGTLADSTPRGNYLDLDVKPAYYAYLGTIEELKLIIRRKASPVQKPWSELIQVAEHKRVRNAKSATEQLRSVLRAHNAYRPDLATSHSFAIERGTVQLGSLNACGMVISPTAPWTDLNSWVAHVALLYDTHRPRDDSYDPRKQPDRDIQYCSAQRDFYRWDVRDEEGKGVAVSPFYVSRPPGRSTFACFDILPLPKDDPRTDPESLAAMGEVFSTGAVQGFWKMSWQSVSSSPTELELLSELHQDGWVPGLVRPFELKHIEKESPKTKEPEGKTDVDMTAEPQGTTGTVELDGRQEATAAATTIDKQTIDPAVQAKLDARLKEQTDRAIYHPSIKPDVVGDELGRVKDVLHLGSIGQPLSQCNTARDLLKVMYDLIEVHSHLCDLDILHRDVSWFNVMCNPKHLIKLHPLLQADTVLSRPCINQILGEGDPEPCVLLTDLDHAIKLDGTATRRSGERTGTPMFISAELTNPRKLYLQNQDMEWIAEDLREVERHAEEFARAFPGGDGDFMRDFEQVMELEKERRKKSRKPAASPPVGVHDPRHDAESIYWVFLWAFARARPLNASPIESRLWTLDMFCTAMFRHAPDSPLAEAARGLFLTSASHIGGLMHPLLEPFEELFRCMSTYLTIPWYLYCGGDKAPRNIMKPNHVHVAFRRFTLAFILKPANAAALETVLDTEIPRYTSMYETPRWFRPMPKERSSTRSDSDAAPDAQGAMPPHAQKRKASSTSLPPRKRKASGPAAPGDNPVSTDDESDTSSDDDVAEGLDKPLAPEAVSTAAPPVGKSADDLPVKYVASEHQHSESAMALRLMIWKDRTLWFGPGINPNPKPETEQDGYY